MRKSLKEVESIYNLTIADHELPEGYSEGDLEEILYNLELIDIENGKIISSFHEQQEEDSFLTHKSSPQSDIPQTENVNIWEEPQEGNIMFEKDGQIKCATLNKLVEYLTNESTGFVLFSSFAVYSLLLLFQIFMKQQKWNMFKHF
jgi:hypothetical protein